MTRPVSLPTPANSAALSAFLQGIEARAWVFCLSQCGNGATAERVLEKAFQQFAKAGPSVPLSRWPLQFWIVLLAQPALLTAGDASSELGQLPPGPRAALLLRLLAGLDLAPASQALGVSVAAYTTALEQATSTLDPERIQRLREHLHEQIHGLPAARRQALVHLRGAALGVAAAEPSFVEPAATAHRRPRMLLWLGLAGLLLIWLATFLWPLRSSIAPGASEALPGEQVAPPPDLTDTVVVTHPDYSQLARPAEDRLAQQLPFLSWIAATMSAPLPVTPAAALIPAPVDFESLPSSSQSLLSSAGAAWPVLDEPTRQALLANARDWTSRNAAQRNQLRHGLIQWDRQPAIERARRRASFLAWEALSASDQQRIRAAVGYVKNLPADEAVRLRAQFSASPADTQALWWLGPALGAELAPISSLFAFLPEADRPVLLRTLRGLDADSRANLALVAPRLTEARRQALRRELLATPPAARAALIRKQLDQ